MCFGEEAGARNRVFFRVKWLHATMKGTSSVRRVRLGSFCARIVPPMCFATSGCVCVRSSMRFLNLWLQIALEWLLHCRLHGIRWEELRWDEVWGVKSAVSSVGREECSVKFGVWRKQWEMRSVKCGLWSVTFGVRRVQCEVWTVKCEVWSAKSAMWSVKCGVLRVQCEVKCWLRRVQCEVWRLSSVKCDVELQIWHVQHDTSFAECTHAPAWLAQGACKFYRRERSYIYL